MTSPAPGQNVLPLEAFEVRSLDGSTVYAHYNPQPTGKNKDVAVGPHTMFHSPEAAAAYLRDMRKSWDPHRYLIIDLKGKEADNPNARAASQPSASARNPQKSADDRAQRTSPDKHASDAKPTAPKQAEPNATQRSMSTRPAAGDGRPAKEPVGTRLPNAHDRATPGTHKPSDTERGATAFVAGLEQFGADTLGMLPLSMAFLNPIGAYFTYKALHPVQTAMESQAAELFHAAEGTDSNIMVNALAFAGTFLPSLIGGPEEEVGVVGSKMAESVAGPAAHALEEGAVNITRFTSCVIDEAAGKVPRWCFTGEALVASPSGLVPIDELRAGDAVASWDFATGGPATGRVAQIFRNDAREFVRLQTANDTITVTPGHPFWIADRGWIPAAAVCAGQRGVNRHGRTVEFTRCEPIVGYAPIYNLEITDAHTYFVSRDGFLVHNACNVVQVVRDKIGSTARKFAYEDDVMSYGFWKDMEKPPDMHGHHLLLKHMFLKSDNPYVRQLADYVPTIPVVGIADEAGLNEHLALLHGNGPLDTVLKDNAVYGKALTDADLEYACELQWQVYKSLGMESAAKGIERFMTDAFYPVLELSLEMGVK